MTDGSCLDGSIRGSTSVYAVERRLFIHASIAAPHPFATVARGWATPWLILSDIALMMRRDYLALHISRVQNRTTATDAEAHAPCAEMRVAGLDLAVRT